jgi:WD40 repeat protein
MGYRIFLSYGHDEYSDLARKLKQDLEARGNEVWFDEQQLTVGADWETRIEQGLEWAASEPNRGRVVLLMTPHSVRRPDGYCLNELSRAISRGLPIVPVMVVWAEPPLSICRIQWLDLRDCVPLGVQPAAYDRKLGLLTNTIEHDQIDFEGVQARLMALLDPLPFEAEINEHLARFVGRDWIFKKVDAWLADANAEKIFWITGPPGAGKTALAARLASSRLEIAAIHFCRAGHTQKSDPRRCVLSIAYQLATQLPDYESRLNALPLQAIIAESDAQTLFDRLVVQPLAGNFSDPKRTLVVLIDALDEATQSGRNALAAFLAAEFPKTPGWLRLVITSRPDPEVMYPLQGITADAIDAASDENEADIRAFLLRELRSHLLDIRNADAVIDRIVERSEGSFLYVEWLRKEIMAGRLSLADDAALPKGLGGVYSQFVARQWPDPAAFKIYVGPALDVIAAAREPLSLGFLGELNGWSERQQNDFENALGSLFTVREERILPFHKSLIDWLTDRGKAGPYFVSASDGNRRLTDYCLREFNDKPLALSDYTRNHLPAHLIADKRWDALEVGLTNLAFLEAKCESAGVFALVADFAAALAGLPPGRPLGATLQRLDDAIRRDLHFIGRHPTTLFQCLWNLCWWYDCPEAEFHYTVLSKGDGASAAPPPWKREGPKLHALLESWRKEKQARQPNFIWVRSLRPPALPLGTGHLVLGGHSETIHTVGLSGDGERLVSGSRDSTVRLWDTRSGANILVCKTNAPVYAAAISADARLIAAVSAMSTSVSLWQAATGKLVRELGPHEKALECIAFSPNGRFLAAGSDDATVVIWDVTTSERVALLRGGRNRTESVAFPPDGAVLLSGGGWGYRDNQYLYVWDWRAGTLLRRITAHTSLINRVIFAPDGRRFASAAGDAAGEYTIKIWTSDNDAPLVLNGHRESVQDIGFSPDGSKIVSGSWDHTLRLWDSLTGAQLLTIDIGNQINCAGYFPDGRRVYSAGYDNVVRIWDSLAGASEAPSRPDGADNLWRLCYSPDGSVLATGSEHGAVVLWDGNTGRPLREMRPWVCGPVNNMVFSPDGRQLAVGTGNVPWEFDSDVPWEGRSDFGIRIFDVASGAIAGGLDGLACKVSPRALCYSADGKQIVTPLSDQGKVVVWDATSFSRLEEVVGQAGQALVAGFDATPVAAARRIEAKLRAPETVFIDRTSGHEIAWFSQPLFEIAAHPGRAIWAGRSDDVNAHQNTACRIDMVAVEGVS